MRLQHITTADHEAYRYMESLLQASFPIDEYRDLDQLRLYADTNPHFVVNTLVHDEQQVGLLNYWTWSSMCYVEHFAIDPAFRNSGLGSKAFQCFKEEVTPLPIVLEVERPELATTVEERSLMLRRIDFYRRLGLELWDADYLQPSYRQGGSTLPMRLMSSAGLNEDTDYHRVKQTIYKWVYDNT